VEENFNFELFTEEHIKNFTEQQRTVFNRYATRFTENLWCGPTDQQIVEENYSYFFNHHCDPSVWIINDFLWVARKDIEPGQQATIHYSSIDFIHNFECDCGHEHCVKVVQKDGWRDPGFIHRFYPNMLGWIKNKIDEFYFIENTIHE